MIFEKGTLTSSLLTPLTTTASGVAVGALTQVDLIMTRLYMHLFRDKRGGEWAVEQVWERDRLCWSRPGYLINHLREASREKKREKIWSLAELGCKKTTFWGKKWQNKVNDCWLFIFYKKKQEGGEGRGGPRGFGRRPNFYPFFPRTHSLTESLLFSAGGAGGCAKKDALLPSWKPLSHNRSNSYQVNLP